MDTMSEKQYEAAAAFWKRKDAEAVKMPKEELRGWLEERWPLQRHPPGECAARRSSTAGCRRGL